MLTARTSNRTRLGLVGVMLALSLAGIAGRAHLRMGGEWWVVGPPLNDTEDLWGAAFGNGMNTPLERPEFAFDHQEVVWWANQRVLIWHEQACPGRQTALRAWGTEGPEGIFTRGDGEAVSRLADGPGYCVETAHGYLIFGSVSEAPHWEVDARAGPGWPVKSGGTLTLGKVGLRLQRPPPTEDARRWTDLGVSGDTPDLAWLAPARFSRLLPEVAAQAGADWYPVGTLRHFDEGATGAATRFARRESFPPMVAMGIDDVELCAIISRGSHPSLARGSSFFVNRTATQFFNYGADGVSCIMVLYGW